MFFVRSYTTALAKFPILTKSVTAASFAASGDAMGQMVIERRDSLDLGRLVRFCAPAFAVGGVAGHFWYAALNKMFPHTPLYRVLLDQLCFAPAVLVSFFAVQEVLHPSSSVKEKITECLPTALALNYCIWPLAQYINQRFVPLHHQVGFVSAVGFCWNVTLSIINTKK